MGGVLSIEEWVEGIVEKVLMPFLMIAKIGLELTSAAVGLLGLIDDVTLFIVKGVSFILDDIGGIILMILDKSTIVVRKLIELVDFFLQVIEENTNDVKIILMLSPFITAIGVLIQIISAI